MSDVSKMLDAVDLPPEVRKLMPEPGTTAKILQGPMKELRDTYLKIAKAAQPLARALTQMGAELEEAERRQEASMSYHLLRSMQNIDPRLQVQLVTGSSGGCRVVAKRLGGWS